jgi:flagellar hook-associated protein 3 FlgL
MKQQIYQEGNTNYAGRYVFTGYKTDSSLIFTEDTPNMNYSITENFTGEQIQIIDKTIGGYKLSDYATGNTFDKAPQYVQSYRLQMSYDGLSATKPNVINCSTRNTSGVLVNQTFNITRSCSLEDPAAYTPAGGEINYIPETGEVILGKAVYETLRTAENINLTYDKSGFAKGDLKPEHYFNCKMTDSLKPEQDEITFKKEAQKIQYEVNFNQKLTINTEGSDAFSHQIGRTISDIMNAVDEVISVENIITEVESRLKDTTISDNDKARYKKMKEQLDTELELKKENMQQAFAHGMTMSSSEQNRVNIAVADLGSRYVRLELTEERLSSQKVDFEELLSTNEDADITETIIKYSSAEAIYNASLSAASKIVQNTLLDYLR